MAQDKVRPRNLLFGFLIAVGVISGFSTTSSIMFENYGITTGNSTIDNVSKYDDIIDFSSGFEERTNIKVTGIDPLDNFIVGTFSSVKFVFDIPDKMATWVNQIGFLLGIPEDALIIIGIVISLIIAFTFVEIITKGET